ncbi:MAG: hypothetical protein QGI33_03320 [Candidatus Brocadiia bacterium]|jgi:hypothetical protein|nr:hypothetical protein [Candidatus Brocadiia bacterium]
MRARTSPLPAVGRRVIIRQALVGSIGWEQGRQAMSGGVRESPFVTREPLPPHLRPTAMAAVALTVLP